MNIPAIKSQEKLNSLKSSLYNTILGPMLIIADDNVLHLLEFETRKGLEKEIERLKKKTNSTISFGRTIITQSIERELDDYFAGYLKEFKTPICIYGSEFQRLVWQELIKIPYGETRSYLQQAQAILKPTAFRAVANANGTNQLAIIIPCHRIINHNGKFGGYGGGVEHKKWLIEHERRNKNIIT